MSPTTVQRYLRMANEDALGVDALLQLEDPELNHRFNGGNPAYCDERFEDFKKWLPHFEQELKKPHMTTLLLWEEYRKDVPDGYGLTQFRFHLKQDTVAIKPSTVLKMLHQPAGKMYIDFAGDRLSYVDMETGEVVPVETFAAVLPCSGYTFITCIQSQGIEHFLGAVDAAIRFFGGAPRILVPDNQRSAVKTFDRWSPGLTDGLNDLATCDYIRHGYPIIITGPIGTGKSWLASALGHHACLCGYKVRYYNVMKLFEELTMARIESRLPKLFERLSQYDLLILDDFAIKKLTAEQVLDLMEIIEDRHGNKSTIFASQLPVANWYETLDSNVSEILAWNGAFFDKGAVAQVAFCSIEGNDSVIGHGFDFAQVACRSACGNNNFDSVFMDLLQCDKGGDRNLVRFETEYGSVNVE